MNRRWAALAALALAIAGSTAFGHGVWIHAKARLAQVLLEQAWEETRAGGARVRPWSWADTWPVARLTVPAQGADLIVLAGAGGAVMAFGPGHLDGSAPPGTPGNTVLAGHRDTHFAFLRHVAPGDAIRLETPDGVCHRYRVASARVVDEGDPSPVQPAGEDVLTLITCYPFDALVPGGPLRYVVTAVKEAEPGRPLPHARSASSSLAVNGPPKLPAPPESGRGRSFEQVTSPLRALVHTSSFQQRRESRVRARWIPASVPSAHLGRPTGSTLVAEPARERLPQGGLGLCR